MKQYLDSLKRILAEGVEKGDRTGTGTISVFGHQERYDLRKGFPIVTTKFVPIKKIAAELIWLLEGSTDNNRLNELGASIWDEWAVTEEQINQLSDRYLEPFQRFKMYLEHLRTNHQYTDEEIQLVKNNFNKITVESGAKIFDDAGIPAKLTYAQLGVKAGALGPIYGKQWRSWACPDGTTVDQITEVIKLLRTKPDSRRLLVSAWNPADLPDESKSPQQNVLDGKASLASCHTFFQFYTNVRSISDLDNAMFALDNFHDEIYPELAEYLSVEYKEGWVKDIGGYNHPEYESKVVEIATKYGVPTRELSCQLYIRS